MKRLALLFLLAACPLYGQSVSYTNVRPDWREIEKAKPMCSVQDKATQKYATYECGHGPAWIGQLEAHNTVWVYNYSPKHKTADLPFWLFVATSVGAAVADEELTQRNLRLGRGFEGNVLLGHTRGQAYAVIGGTEALAIFSALHRKRAMTMNKELGIERGARFWDRLPWYTPFVGLTATHAVGIGSNLK